QSLALFSGPTVSGGGGQSLPVQVPAAIRLLSNARSVAIVHARDRSALKRSRCSIGEENRPASSSSSLLKLDEPTVVRPMREENFDALALLCDMAESASPPPAAGSVAAVVAEGQRTPSPVVAKRQRAVQ